MYRFLEQTDDTKAALEAALQIIESCMRLHCSATGSNADRLPDLDLDGLRFVSGYDEGKARGYLHAQKILREMIENHTLAVEVRS